MAKFQDKYEPTEGAGSGVYVGEDEKNELASGGIPFKVVDVVYEAEGKYGAEYTLVVYLPTDEDEERKMTFRAGSNVGSRDDMLEQATEFFEGDKDAEPFWLKLEKSGRAWLLEFADEPTKPAAKPRRRAAAK